MSKYKFLVARGQIVVTKNSPVGKTALRFQFLIIFSERESLQWQPALRVASWRPTMKFWSLELNFWSHWQPGRRNFGPWMYTAHTVNKRTKEHWCSCVLPLWPKQSSTTYHKPLRLLNNPLFVARQVLCCKVPKLQIPAINKNLLPHFLYRPPIWV